MYGFNSHRYLQRAGEMSQKTCLVTGINPLLPSAAYMQCSANFFYFNLRRDHQKNFL